MPSSQVSPASSSTVPSPQRGPYPHVGVHPPYEPTFMAPSSHASPACTTPSPQRGPHWHSGAQNPYSPRLLPSSHSSPRSLCTMAAPHVPINRQVSVHISPPSHCSPHSSWITPSPQRSAQTQPAPHSRYPPSLMRSSHCSLPLTIPSPQNS